MRGIIFVLFSIILGLNIYCQPKWSQIYFPDQSTYSYSFSNSYDHGYLLLGKYGHNAVEYNWLLKTDINGQILWTKTFGCSGYILNLNHLSKDNFGNKYLCGGTNINGTHDPIVIKIDTCGNKSWCKVIYTPEVNGFASQSICLEDGGCVVLYFAGTDMYFNRINLARLSVDGDLIWMYTHVSSDTNISNSYGRSIIQSIDEGFIITGNCYYVDPDNPSISWSKPYYLKLDSSGVFEWEMVAFKDVGGESGGDGWNTTVNPSETHYYSSISHYYPDSDSPALLKMDFSGNILDVYDLITGYNHGGLANATFLNDSILAGSAGWGNSQDDIVNHAVLLDTLGEIINETELVQDIYGSHLQVSFDQKLCYMYHTFQNSQFDVYLRKLNLNLDDDTFYSFPYQYDTLCSHPILSDTICQEGCDIIVGIHDYQMSDAEDILMEIYPNPARHFVNIRYSISDIRYSIHIYDMFGRLMKEIVVPVGQDESRVDLSDFPNGIYVAVLRNNETVLGRKKFVVVRE